MKLETWQINQILAPRPIVLVTTVDQNKKINAAPFSFISPVSFKPSVVMLSFDPSRHTYQNIVSTKEFVMNFLGKEHIDKVLRCAENYPRGVNELEQVRLDWYSSELVKPPRVKDAKAWLECRFIDERKAGDHIAVFGEVLVAEISDEMVTDGKADLAKLNPTLHIGKDDFVEDFKIVKHKRYDR